MAETFGSYKPVTIPALTDPANIQVALKEFYYGSAGDAADSAELVAATDSVGSYIENLSVDKANKLNDTLTGSTLESPTINSPEIHNPTFDVGDIDQKSVAAGADGQLLRVQYDSVTDAYVPTWVNPDTVPVSEAAKVQNAITFNSSGSGGSSPQSFDGSSTKTISYNTIGAAAQAHVHGNISSLGAIGATAGLIIKTGTSGVLGALSSGLSGQFLKHDATWGDLPTATTSALGVVRADGSTINIASGIISVNADSENTASTVVIRNSNSEAKLNVLGKVTTDTTGASVGKIYVQSTEPTGVAVGDIWMW